MAVFFGNNLRLILLSLPEVHPKVTRRRRCRKMSLELVENESKEFKDFDDSVNLDDSIAESLTGSTLL